MPKYETASRAYLPKIWDNNVGKEKQWNSILVLQAQHVQIHL
jgi:hypothetical protein